MLEQASPLRRSLLHSPLKEQSTLRPKGNKRGRSMIAGLMLTSLVDAFSILVIFLIVNTSTNQESVDVDMKKMALPVASESQLIMQGITVRADDHGNYLVEKKQVQKSNLVAELKALYASSSDAKKEGLIIVADKTMSYEELSPVILAGSTAGFQKFKFAVVRSDK
jgi:biopolymer transport protein ExbD